MPSSLYEWGCSVPWCITPEALDAMLQIAARETLDADDLKAIMHGPKSLALRDGKRREGARHTDQAGPVARIVIDGPIYRYADYFTKYSGGVTTEALAKEFQAALDDPSVAAIALIIDSPGGEATGINELADTIYAARGQKPIHAYIEGYGASAAYWIASAADTVTVDENALVGSIGTVAGYPDPSKRVKYTIDFVSSQSPKKRVDPTSEAGAAYLQQLVDDMTEVFIAKVMRNRGMTREQVLAIEGGMVIGQQAVAAGLADSLGSEDQTLRGLAEQAGRKPLDTMKPPARVPGGIPVRMTKERPMSDNKTGFWAWISGKGAPDEGDTPPTIEPRTLAPGEALASAPLPPTSAITSATPIANPLADRLRELETQINEQQTQARQAQAAAFADGAVRARQAYPAERQALYNAYIQASEDDSARPLAAGSATRVQQIEAMVSSRTPHSLTEELLATNQGGALPSGAPAAAMSEERHQSLLAMTPLGQSVLRKRAKSA